MGKSNFYKNIVQISRENIDRIEIAFFHIKIEEAAFRGETQVVLFDHSIKPQTIAFLQKEGFKISVSYDCTNKDDNVITIKWEL